VQVVLSSRSAITEIQQRHLQKLQDETSGAVEYLPVDVGNLLEVEQFISNLKEKYGQLNGIIHAAGVLRDNYLINKTIEDIDAVLAPKVKGLINIDEASRAEPLDFMVLFSSVSGVLGSSGQSDYAAANVFLDAYAQYRQQLVNEGKCYGRTLAINWPLWQSGGMSVDAETKQMLYRQSGVQAMSTTSGLRAFAQSLSSNESQVLVISGDTKKLRTHLLNKTSENHHDTNNKISLVDTAKRNAELEYELKEIVSVLLKIKPEKLSLDTELTDYGLDSIGLVAFVNRLNEKFQLKLTPTVFLEYKTLASISDYLIDNNDVNVHRGTKVSDIRVGNNKNLNEHIHIAREPIAIIGMSGVMPGSEDLDAFWKHLETGTDLISETPNERWDWYEKSSISSISKHRAAHRSGGFISDIDKFDAAFFDISKQEAELMDPQHRLFLQTAWRCIEDAGYRASALSGQRMGVYVGVQLKDYANLISQTLDEINAEATTGNAHTMLANRVSYLLNVHGPSEAIDTACSSSLVAVHRAVQLLQYGDIDSALTGGVNLNLSPASFIAAENMGYLSPDGRCKPFTKDANGYVKGEGVGVVMLKRLSDAKRDGDHIYGVIRGSSENHGGRTSSLTTPNSKAQSNLLVDTYKKAKISIETISYIEAHGTGTKIGDVVEIEGLKQAFTVLSKNNNAELKQQYCGIGSVKSNIGYLEPASGIAGLLKVLLSMQHKKLCGTLHYKETNPYLDLDDSPFHILSETQDWKPLTDNNGNVLPRRAGVSSFGFGGVNAHVVVEEYDCMDVGGRATHGHLQDVGDRTASETSSRVIAEKSVKDKPQLIVLSAKNEERLKKVVKNLHYYLTEQSPLSTDHFQSLIYTLQEGREAMESRVAFLVEKKESLIQKLEALIDGKQVIDHCYQGNINDNKKMIEAFTDDQQLKETLTGWFSNRKLEKIAELWVKGLEIDWLALYGEHRPQRISLPVYPFAKERYWLSNNTQQKNQVNNKAGLHSIK
jgi:3-oxoacyl-(acyl-carrier-protein) synthase/acyl carrier protein